MENNKDLIEEIKDTKMFIKGLSKMASIGSDLLEFHRNKLKELEDKLKEIKENK